MIDLKFEAKNFAPMTIPEEGNGVSDDVRWSYSLYNKSLQYIKKGYEDLARQSLKKAIGLNTDFHPARMLLGVALFANGDRIGAMRMFNSITDMRYKKLAMAYSDYLAEEADKPASASATRLILKDLYRETYARDSKIAEVTRKEESILPEEDGDETIPGTEEAASETSGVVEATEAEPAPEHETEPEPAPEKPKLSFAGYNDGPEDIFTSDNSGLEPAGADDDSDLEVPSFFNAPRRPAVITSKKNDGVVEEIVKQKRDDAIRAAKYSDGKKPFSFDETYHKKVFSDNKPEETAPEAASRTEDEPRRSKRDDAVIAIASIVVLIFLIIISVLLMQNISENRKLKNELDDLQKAYREATETTAYVSDTEGNPVFYA